jgi:hypothetical protein
MFASLKKRMAEVRACPAPQASTEASYKSGLEWLMNHPMTCQLNAPLQVKAGKRTGKPAWSLPDKVQRTLSEARPLYSPTYGTRKFDSDRMATGGN